MTCTNCGSAFHEKWACTKPLKVAEEAISTGGVEGHALRQGYSPDQVRKPAGVEGQVDGSDEPDATGQPSAGIKSGPVDTTPKRGRPKTITDMRTYKANKAKQYRASKRLGK